MIGTITPSEGLESNEVLTTMNIRGYVKLGCHLSVLRIANILTVDPQVNVRGDRAEMGNDLLTRPIGRNSNRATVRPHMVVLDGHLWRIVLEMTAPRKSHIHIFRVAIAVQFPDTRHRHVHPVLRIIVHTEEIRWPLIGMFHPEEAPSTVQRQTISLRERCMHRITVDLIDLQVVPLRHGGLLGYDRH